MNTLKLSVIGLVGITGAFLGAIVGVLIAINTYTISPADVQFEQAVRIIKATEERILRELSRLNKGPLTQRNMDNLEKYLKKIRMVNENLVDLYDATARNAKQMHKIINARLSAAALPPLVQAILSGNFRPTANQNFKQFYQQITNKFEELKDAAIAAGDVSI